MRKENKCIVFFVFSILLLLTGCQNNNNELEELKKENEQLKQQIQELTKNDLELQDSTEVNTNASKDDTKINTSEFSVEFKNNDESMTFGNSEHIAEVKDIAIVYSTRLDEYLLIIDFRYNNKGDEAHNFINDIYCNVIAYQNGIELDTPGIASEEGVYDTVDSYKRIKNAEIDTQLAFVLYDTESDIELELGSDYFSSLVIKTITISKN